MLVFVLRRSVAPVMGLLPRYHCQVMVFSSYVVRVSQGGHDFPTHLGLQCGQGHRSGFVHVGDLNRSLPSHSGVAYCPPSDAWTVTSYMLSVVPDPWRGAS